MLNAFVLLRTTVSSFNFATSFIIEVWVFSGKTSLEPA